MQERHPAQRHPPPTASPLERAPASPRRRGAPRSTGLLALGLCLMAASFWPACPGSPAIAPTSAVRGPAQTPVAPRLAGRDRGPSASTVGRSVRRTARVIWPSGAATAPACILALDAERGVPVAFGTAPVMWSDQALARYTLIATAPGCDPCVQTWDAGPLDVVATLELHASALLQVRVIDARGLPIGGVSVGVLAGEAERPALNSVQVTNAAGEAEFGIPAAKSPLHVLCSLRAPGYLARTVPWTVSPGDARQETVVLERGTALRLAVPEEWADVPGLLSVASVGPEGWTGRFECWPDEAARPGGHLLGAIPGGPVTLTVRTGQGLLLQRSTPDIPPVEYLLRIAGPRPRAAAVRVLAADGAGVPGADVRIYRGGASLLATLTDPNGEAGLLLPPDADAPPLWVWATAVGRGSAGRRVGSSDESIVLSLPHSDAPDLEPVGSRRVRFVRAPGERDAASLWIRDQAGGSVAWDEVEIPSGASEHLHSTAERPAEIYAGTPHGWALVATLPPRGDREVILPAGGGSGRPYATVLVAADVDGEVSVRPDASTEVHRWRGVEIGDGHLRVPLTACGRYAIVSSAGWSADVELEPGRTVDLREAAAIDLRRVLAPWATSVTAYEVRREGRRAYPGHRYEDGWRVRASVGDVLVATSLSLGRAVCEVPAGAAPVDMAFPPAPVERILRDPAGALLQGIARIQVGPALARKPNAAVWLHEGLLLDGRWLPTFRSLGTVPLLVGWIDPRGTERFGRCVLGPGDGPLEIAWEVPR